MIKFLTRFLIALLLASIIVIYSTKNRVNNEVISTQTQNIGGDFTLTNQDGAQVSDADFRGKIMLVFFGFTNCGDECPATAATFARVLDNLGDKAAEVTPVLITVDPKSDTPAVLKDFLAKFDTRIVGLTGSEEDIQKLMAEYQAYARNKEANSSSSEDYEIDHSSFIYLMDKDGKYAQHFSYDAPVEAVTKAVE